MVCFRCKCEVVRGVNLGGSVMTDWLGGIAPVCKECVDG